MTSKPIDPESLYLQIGQLVESMPDLTRLPLSPETHKWLGRAHSLVALNDPTDAISLRVYVDSLAISPDMAAHEITAVVYRALARAERAAPVSARGSFIPAGNALDAMAAVGKVLSAATRDVLILDPYMDEKALFEFAALAPEKVQLRLLADQKFHKPTLEHAARRWREQFGEARPLTVKLASPATLHDRAIFVDRTQVWLLSQSLNAFAARSPATIVRVTDEDMAKLKMANYEQAWKTATAL